MCWNAQVSIATFVFGLFATTFTFYHGVLTASGALYYLSFTSIQLVEFFTWQNLDNDDVIRALSQVGLALIMSQPVCATMMLLPTKHKRWIPHILVAYTIASCALVLPRLVRGELTFAMRVGTNCHLAWDWLNFPESFYVVYFVGILLPFMLRREWIAVAFSSGSALVCYVLHRETRTWGTLWCWIANFVGIVLIVLVFTGYGNSTKQHKP
eukprot:c12545_g1_i1.p1 GENE.c12545_g1_i1~~c12545_g1_i1.p1  ORF type:complete len:211 (-),score=19.95 c12545_g1_i1:1189-1821(-)